MQKLSTITLIALFGAVSQTSAYTGSTIGVQSTGLYSTYWLPTDLNSKGSSWGTNGTHSPSSICTTYDTTSTCSVVGETYNYKNMVADTLSSRNLRSTCKTSTHAKCTKAALSSYFTGNAVKLAYCTDTHIVIWSDTIPSWGSN